MDPLTLAAVAEAVRFAVAAGRDLYRVYGAEAEIPDAEIERIVAEGQREAQAGSERLLAALADYQARRAAPPAG